MKVLGLDYGTKETGIAISSPSGLAALPLTTIKASKNRQLISKLLRLIVEYKVEEIVCGLPMTTDNEISQMGERINQFIVELKLATEIPIYTWNENHTSQLAATRYKSNDPRIHAEAARIILQEYLNKKKEHANEPLQ